MWISSVEELIMITNVAQVGLGLGRRAHANYPVNVSEGIRSRKQVGLSKPRTELFTVVVRVAVDECPKRRSTAIVTNGQGAHGSFSRCRRGAESTNAPVKDSATKTIV